MTSTSLSLLQRTRALSDAGAWKRLVDLYQPLIHGWLRRSQVPPQDADDLTQEVLALLVQEVPHFVHNGQTGAFRHWLKTITVNRMRAFWRAGRCRSLATGDSDFLHTLDEIEDADGEMSRLWDREHDDHVLRRLLELMASEFEPTTLQAFRRVALDGVSAEEVAAELSLSAGAVYVAKSRVLRRLREEAQGLID
jgi:RNA polymerase sigma-70 factor (ECF subfamily)